MARKHRKKLKRTEEEHNFLSIKVSHFDVSIESSINYNLRVDRPIIIRNGEELAFLNETRLEITGLCVAPKDRVNEEYEISIWGSERYVGEHDLMLRHYQAKDEHGSPKYRQYRGQSYPVYEPPLGLGSISKNRDIGIWQSVIWVKPRLASDMLVMLNQKRTLYLAIHETKKGRQRWVQSVGLQTTNPVE